MKTKHSLFISGIVGGVIGSLLTASLVSPVTAQRDKFDTIQCSRLEVVDETGMPRVALMTDEGSGFVGIGSKDKGFLTMASHFITFGGKESKPVIRLSIDERGGHVSVYGKGKGQAAMGINEYGNGVVSTWDKNGNRQ